MRGTKAKNWQGIGAFAVVLAAIFYLLMLLGHSTLQVHAETSAKVTASSANIRKEANASSQIIASVLKDDMISIRAKTTGSDGKVWYQVFVDSETLGFIRADLVQASGEVTETVEAGSSTGSLTPSTGGGTSGGGTSGGSSGGSSSGGSGGAAPDDNITAEIIPVNPVSATTSTDNVNVRKNCSTNSSVVKTVAKDMALTVTGQTTGSDGKTWYQVTFISDGSEVSGFVHSDYITLSGEVVPVSDGGEDQPEDPGQPNEPEDIPQVSKDYEVVYNDGKWFLYDHVNEMNYELPALITGLAKNATALENSLAKVKTQTTVIVILAVVLVLVLLVLVLGIFKFKDELFGDSFGFREEAPVRRRPMEQRRPAGQRPSASGSGRSGGSSMSRPAGGGTGRAAGSSMSRPSGGGSAARPSGSSQTARPSGNGTGARPSGSSQGRPPGSGTGTRPAGSSVSRPSASSQARPAGNGTSSRPSGSSQSRTPGSGTGARPAGSAARPSGAGTRHAGSQAEGPATDTISPAFDMTGQTARPEQIKRETARSLEEQQIQRKSRPAAKETAAPRKPKNFMTDDDEFEFEFLNWDGEEEI